MANSVEKTMQVLRALSDGRGKATALSALSEHTGINKSTLSHILKVLCAEGYVTHISHCEGYTVGPEIFFLTRYGRLGEEITSGCHSLLELLNRETGGTAIFAVLNKGKKYIIDYVEGHISYRDSGATIISDDVYRTVTGRVLLSHLPADEALEVFRESGVPDEKIWKEVRNERDYLNELGKIRRQSVYVNLTDSPSDRLASFASPIYKGNKCIAAMGLVLKKDGADTAGVAELVNKCKTEAERRLAFK